MSQYWETQAWETDLVSGLDKFVAVAMGRHAGEDGLSWPSVKTLSVETGVGVTKVGLALRAIEDSGLFRRATDGEVAKLGAPRSVVYRFVAEPMSPPRGEHSPPHGDHSPAGGYVWQPSAAPAPAPLPLRHAESSPRHAESALRSTGTTSSTSNGDDHEPSPNAKKVRGNGTVTSRLMAQFSTELKIAVSENDGVALGPFKREALARTFGLLQKRDGLTEEQISSMVTTYLARPSNWNPQIHPWQDFCSGGTLTRLRNQTKWRDDSEEYIDPAEALTEVMPALTVAEILRRDLETGATWLRPKSS